MENKELPPLLINVRSTSEDIDLEEIERNTHSLGDDLNELDVIKKVELVTKGEAPEVLNVVI